MGRVTDWIVSSLQSCISCVSVNDGDARPAKAKKRKPRKFRMMKSAAVSPHHDYPKDKTTAKADVSRTHAGDFPCTKGRPLPMPFTSGCKRNKVEPTKANKKIKGAHPCKCCVNTQHDPYKIKLRLSSKLHQHNVDERVCTTAGDKDVVMKNIDQEVREKVDRMFGKSETTRKYTNRSNGSVAARKTKKRGLQAKPMESNNVPGHVRIENLPLRKNGTEDTEEVPSTDSVSTKDKMSPSAVTGGNNTDGYCSHDDDDDVVIGNPTPVPYSYKLNYSIPVYPDDHDDDYDIVIGNPTPVPYSYKLNYSIPVYPDDHDDDDDIVIGN
ncbi:uncharacterized protein LOC124291128 [Haliotis rubra]|uniref:uncharacterized protein LOC124291128 n=1 Tax=Haliotis rubra TaxID=36100 RepID=UPI001EE5F980|nr:uncharacterized protein LOC124291128 [Haliotis rubra]